MTDVEFERRKAICEAANVDDIGEVSDGSHTFDSLYEQRMILFAALVKAYRSKAWKSYRHEDGEYCFGGGWFIVGIDTPEGSYTYHYKNKYWNMFDCVDLPRAPHWDGHTEADAETRLMSLEPEIKTDGDTISRQQTIDALMQEFKRIPTNSIRAKIVVENLPSAQPETNCSEIPNNSGLISRQDAIDTLYHVDEYNMLSVKAIRNLPSAQPKPKIGQWIPDEIAAYDMPNGKPRGWVPWLCSECGYCVGKHQTRFCPDCGALMCGKAK